MLEKIKDIKWLEPFLVAIVTTLTGVVSKMSATNLIIFIIAVAVLYALYKALPILYKKVYVGETNTDKHNEFTKQLDLKNDEMDKMLAFIEKKKKLLKEQGLSDSEIANIIKSDVEKFNKRIDDLDKILKL